MAARRSATTRSGSSAPWRTTRPRSNTSERSASSPPAARIAPSSRLPWTSVGGTFVTGSAMVEDGMTDSGLSETVAVVEEVLRRRVLVHGGVFDHQRVPALGGDVDPGLPVLARPRDPVAGLGVPDAVARRRIGAEPP